jgi:hypothetical protein
MVKVGRFGLELRLANNHLRVGQVSFTKQLRALKDRQVVTKTETRRSFVEVLASSLPALEEPFGPSTLPLARVPRWLEAPKVARTKTAQTTTTTMKSTFAPMKGFHAQAKVLAKGFRAQAKTPSLSALCHRSPTKTAMAKAIASMKAILVKEASVKTALALHYGPQPSVSSATLGRVMTVTDIGVVECKTQFVECFDLLNLRKTLVRLLEEIVFCLSGFVTSHIA